MTHTNCVLDCSDKNCLILTEIDVVVHVYTVTIVPQLSKCLKFEAVWGGGGIKLSNDLNLNKEILQDPCVYCCLQNGAS